MEKKKKIRRKIEAIGIIMMLFASCGLMIQLWVNILFFNNRNIIVYSKEINKTIIEIEPKAETEFEVETEPKVETEFEVENEPEIDGENQGEIENAGTTEEKEINPEDLYWLSHVIMAEVEGESYECKIMCGLVVMNRVKDKDFPNSIKDVIFHINERGMHQYACTVRDSKGRNPRIWLEPNEDSIMAAVEILSGNSITIPEDVVYQSQSPMGSGIYAHIGNQYFCRK